MSADPSPSHDTHVSSHAGPAGKVTSIVTCSCGWMSHAYRKRADAQKAADEHAASADKEGE